MISGASLIDYRERYSTKTFFEKRLQRTLIPALLAFCFNSVLPTLFSLPAGKLVDTFKGYLNFPAVMQAVGVFIFFKYVNWEKAGRRFVKFLFFLSKYTFGIYLIHFYFVDSLPVLLNFNSASFYWRTIGAVVVFIISLLISMVLSKIPVVKKCIGI